MRLTAEPQIHSKLVQERKMGLELMKEKERLHEYAEREARRTEAFMRKECERLSRTQAENEKVRHVRDKKKVEIDSERRNRERRQQLREKHDTLKSRKEQIELERQATASAIRKLDDLARRSLQNSKEQVAKELHQTAAGALYVQQHNEAKREDVRRAVHASHLSRVIAEGNFRKEFDRTLHEERRNIYKTEHQQAEAWRKQHSAAPAVEVVWPKDILQPSKSPERSRIADGQYARLCGVRPEILAANDGNIRIEDIDAMKHLAPSHWALLKTAVPNPQWEALQRVQASVVRGPVHVKWQ